MMQNVTRRSVFTLAAGSAIATLGIAAPASAATPTEFGFTINTDTQDGKESYRLPDLDTLVSLGMQWVRINIPTGDIIADWEGDTIRFNEDRIVALSRTISEARVRGLKVYLMSIGGYETRDAAAYVAKMTEYWNVIAKRFASRAAVWQVFNEANGWHYRFYETVSDADMPAYLKDMAEKLSLARGIIRKYGPRTRVTTNLGGYPLHDATEARWHQALDVIAPSLDAVTVDLYPDLWEDAIASIPARMERLKQRYGKPVYVGEIGLPVQTGRFTEAQQAQAYRRYLSTLDTAHIEAAVFYLLRDVMGGDGQLDTFGVYRADGTPRPAVAVLKEFASVRGSMLLA